MDQRTRKLITMNKVLHSRNYIVRLFVLREEKVRGFVNIENCVDA